MAKKYAHIDDLAEQIAKRRVERGLSFEKLGKLSDVDAAQVFRICHKGFQTLNPSVLRICNVLGVQPKRDGYAVPKGGDEPMAKMLSAEVLSAWDRTESGAKRLQRVLRALRD